MSGPLKLLVKNLDKPTQPINLNLISLQKGPNGFEPKGRLQTSKINNDKPTVIIVWVTTHAPCMNNLPQYELLAGLADQLQTVNFIFLDYDPDNFKSEELDTLAQVFGDHTPSFPIHTLDPQTPEGQHPSKQFQSFIVPEFIMLDAQHKTIEHFVLNDRPSFTKALSLISQPPQ